MASELSRDLELTEILCITKDFLFFFQLSSSFLPKRVPSSVQRSSEERLFRHTVPDVSPVCVIDVKQIFFHATLSQRLMMDKFQKVWNLQIIDLEELPQQWGFSGSYRNSPYVADLCSQPKLTETAKGALKPLPEQKGYTERRGNHVYDFYGGKLFQRVMFSRNMCSFSTISLVLMYWIQKIAI